MPDGCRVYLITPPALDPKGFADKLAAALDAGDVAFLLNDRADLVRATGCDGAHVGQEDIPAREARRLMGPDLTLGVTCKGSRDLAMQAGEDSADYFPFGAFYPSSTKAVSALLDPEILAWWSEMMELPSCAIGGITAENCAPLVRAGTDFLAVVGCIWNHPNGA